MDSGWIKLHRKLLDSPLWQCTTHEQKTILITILLMANHAPKKWIWKGLEFMCDSGQLITSQEKIAKNANVSRQNVRTAISMFEKLNFLTNETTKHNTLITIVNWDTYQLQETETNQPANHQLTNAQPTPNQRLTTNKNDKNDKKKNKHFSPEPCEDKNAVFRGEHLTVTDSMHKAFQKAFPGIDLNREYGKMESWLTANPAKRPRSRTSRFAHNWLTRAQERIDFTATKKQNSEWL